MTKHSSSAAAEARGDDDAELKGAPMAGLSMDVVRLFLALIGLLGEHGPLILPEESADPPAFGPLTPAENPSLLPLAHMRPI